MRHTISQMSKTNKSSLVTVVKIIQNDLNQLCIKKASTNASTDLFGKISGDNDDNAWMKHNLKYQTRLPTTSPQDLDEPGTGNRNLELVITCSQIKF